MVKNLTEADAKSTLGVAGQNVHNGTIRSDEFLPELRGRKAIRKYREMRDNDSTIGAVMYAAEQVLRDVELKVHAANDSPEAERERMFVLSVLDDMEHTLDDHVAEALSSLSYGFAWFEVVYKRRVGPQLKTVTRSLSTLMDVWVFVRSLYVRLGLLISLMLIK
jgi:hypothetical protein